MLTYYNINYISTLLRQRPIRWKYVPTNEGSITYAFFPTLSNCTATFKDLCTPKVPLFLNTPQSPTVHGVCPMFITALKSHHLTCIWIKCHLPFLSPFHQ